MTGFGAFRIGEFDFAGQVVGMSNIPDRDTDCPKMVL
jgi:hypothetical protein